MNVTSALLLVLFTTIFPVLVVMCMLFFRRKRYVHRGQEEIEEFLNGFTRGEHDIDEDL